MSQAEQPVKDRAEQSWFAVWGKLSGSFLTLPKHSREECEKLIQTDILGNHYEVRELRTRWDAPDLTPEEWAIIELYRETRRLNAESRAVHERGKAVATELAEATGDYLGTGPVRTASAVVSFEETA